MADSIFAIANERMTINEALKQATGSDYYGSNQKQWCPYADLYHPDDPNTLKVYESTNSAYCFAESLYLSPIRVIALSRDIPDQEAAEQILVETGWVAETADARWDALMAAPTVKVDRDALEEALRISCARIDVNWEDDQLEGDIAVAFGKCLGLLSKVGTEEDATKWLTTTKAFMEREIGAHYGR